MARNRVIYQSEALYVSSGITSTGTGHHCQLERVQSANYNFSINRQDINEYGQAARIDSIVMDAPTVNMDFSYYLTNGSNEKALGFSIDTGSQFISGHMGDSNGANVYIYTVDEGLDAIDSENTPSGDRKSVIGLGNAFVTDYSLELAVGSLPTVSVSMECSNIASTGDLRTGANNETTGVFIPSVNITSGTAATTNTASLAAPVGTGVSAITALRPGDVTIDITGLNGASISDLTDDDNDDGIHIQSASLSIPMSRSPLQRLGSRFAYGRTVDFPINATLNVNAICTDASAQNLADILDDTNGQDIKLTVKDSTADKNVQVQYILKGCRLDSESFSSSIGSNKSVDLTFSTQIGGINDTDNGVFVSGRFAGDSFSD